MLFHIEWIVKCWYWSVSVFQCFSVSVFQCFGGSTDGDSLASLRALSLSAPPFRRASSLPTTRGEKEKAVIQVMGCRGDIGLILRVLVLCHEFVA